MSSIFALRFRAISSVGSEHLVYTQRVGGSNPSSPTKYIPRLMWGFLLMYSVYIIYSHKIDKYYIGYSSNVIERLSKHNQKSKGFSSTGRPWIIVYTEVFENKKDAMNRESQLKKWKNRERLESLINSGSEHPD
jgi:putative endonuclease